MKKRLEKSEVDPHRVNRVYGELIPRAQGLVDGPHPLAEWAVAGSPETRDFLRDFPRTEVWGLDGQPVLWIKL